MKNPKDLHEILFSRNGNEQKNPNGQTVRFLSDEFLEVDREIRELGNLLNRSDLSRETSGIIESFGGHFNQNVLTRLLHRRGSSHRLQAPLADRVLEFEGWGKLHLAVAALQADMVPIISFKIMKVANRLDRMQQVSEKLSDESRELMQDVFDLGRKNLHRIAEELVESFGADAQNRLTGGPNSR